MRKLQLIGAKLFDKKYLLFYFFYSMISMVMNLNSIWNAGLYILYINWEGARMWKWALVSKWCPEKLFAWLSNFFVFKSEQLGWSASAEGLCDSKLRIKMGWRKQFDKILKKKIRCLKYLKNITLNLRPQIYLNLNIVISRSNSNKGTIFPAN